ncbi:acyl-CoA synthetase [Cycloclasticus pugetii]|uniref:AMP-dependent synthetase and ligase n=1 Tax=Cycloclasticus pugetii TaxID=34068 RepID=A0AB33YZH5_9GAMM|nr:acyl-CoA synthetase [Cycloclasticus pugetii]EPD12340.1 AMP-dependent synthetase and ligase [Cycloclasticus pugetii]
MNLFDMSLDKNPANYVSLSPLTFLKRAADVYPNKIACIHGEQKITWAETYLRCVKLASALASRGVKKGDTVSAMLPNIPAMFELHFAVPMLGAVLHSINTRLDVKSVAFQLDHAESKAVFIDAEFADVMATAVKEAEVSPLVIDVEDATFGSRQAIGEVEYEMLVAEGNETFQWSLPEDEWQSITLNYTSGTTGNPKGVVYHHRGAYLNALNNIVTWDMGNHPIYLWTLPMFHCNGWCFPWSLAASAGTNVCLRSVLPKTIFKLIKSEKIDHFCGAPTVLTMLINTPEKHQQGIEHEVKVMTAGAAPPAAVIQKMEEMSFSVTHVYGLTETYGPCTVCAWHDEWDELPSDEQAALRARQGVRSAMLEDLMVADPETLEPMPKDGVSMGEVFMRGNNVMKGYLKNPSASDEAFKGGWFHSGDLAMWHEDGYIDIKDRSKDIIISGGENISTLEVESVLYRHPAILEAAVVAKYDDVWGEKPCAFVTLKEGENATEKEIISFCRKNLAHYKAPKYVVFGGLPKTSTGKIQKFTLREQANEIKH